jgi:TPP-dependent pyruvate/acetoin dehydrogenase alpha subunit
MLQEVPKELLAEMLKKMFEIRFFEEKVFDLYGQNLVPGTIHLYAGEEAVAVGVCTALRKDDFITSTHRGHGHCIAKGADLKRVMAEILGKKTGYCKGKGGSMHIADFSIGMLGATAVVGAGLPIRRSWSISNAQRYRSGCGLFLWGRGFEPRNFSRKLELGFCLVVARGFCVRKQPVRHGDATV